MPPYVCDTALVQFFHHRAKGSQVGKEGGVGLLYVLRAVNDQSFPGAEGQDGKGHYQPVVLVGVDHHAAPVPPGVAGDPELILALPTSTPTFLAPGKIADAIRLFQRKLPTRKSGWSFGQSSGRHGQDGTIASVP